MNKEEKKAIENLKLFLDGDENEDNYMTDEDFRIILNLIEKQEENNKKLKNQLTDIHSNFLKFNWEESNGKQVHNQLKELYESIYRRFR